MKTKRIPKMNSGRVVADDRLKVTGGNSKLYNQSLNEATRAILGVNRNTPLYACRMETGLWEDMEFHDAQTLLFYRRVATTQANELVIQAYMKEKTNNGA